MGSPTAVTNKNIKSLHWSNKQHTISQNNMLFIVTIRAHINHYISELKYEYKYFQNNKQHLK